MITILVLLLLLAALAIVPAAMNLAVLRAWRQERRQLGALADRLYAEARVEALTVQTLQQIREAARTSARNGNPQ
jgi:hypothetical protein